MATELRKVIKLAWRKWLMSEAGVEGLLVLRESAPSVSSDGEAHKIIFQAGIAEGWKRCLDAHHTLIAADEIKINDIENQ
jgi:hypothetical protein